MNRNKDLAKPTSHNVIAYGTKIEGSISTDTDIRIDGFMKGTLSSNGKVIIGEQGLIEGEVTCKNLDVIGGIKGSFNIAETTSLKSTAVVEGDITTKTISIEPNAVFNGTCKMHKNAEC